MPPKIKTIKRRKSWPKWARWYAEDEAGAALFSRKPSWSGFFFAAGLNLDVQPAFDCDEAFSESLRRIID